MIRTDTLPDIQRINGLHIARSTLKRKETSHQQNVNGTQPTGRYQFHNRIPDSHKDRYNTSLPRRQTVWPSKADGLHPMHVSG